MPEDQREAEPGPSDERTDADKLSAWGPGGWSREHGQEHHGSPPEPPPEPGYDRGFDEEAPTG